ncbi:MAG: type II toxin-antitoxin system PemK/MazF family toxin [Candidatus Obscuribacterales bacterium]|nr:type II toxin-antitoxin system PemK/MazF family toxin [Candidatus Obscuribacterales bacterium]
MSSRKSQSLSAPVPLRGEVWLATKNPAIPNDPHLPRPVVIISTNARNKALPNVIVVPFSARLARPFEDFHKFVPKGSGGLPKDCYGRCDLVSTLAKSDLDARGPLGPPLSDKHLWQIARGVRAAIGDNLLV